MKTFVLVLKRILMGMGLFILLLFYLFSILWMDIFHNLGSHFPFLFVFFLPSLLVGWASRRPLWQIFLLGCSPLALALFLFVIYVGRFSGTMRLAGWMRDFWFLALLYMGMILILLSLGQLLRTHSRTLKRWMIITLSSLLLFLTGIQFFSPGYYYIREGAGAHIPLFQMNLEDKSHQEAFELLCQYIEDYYPYFEYKSLDWEKIKGDAREELKAAEDYYSVIARMLNCLQDGHVRINIPLRNKPYQKKVHLGARFVKVNGQWIVFKVYANTPAHKAGLKPGMKLVRLEDQPIRNALASVPEEFINAKKGSLYGQRFGDEQRLQHLLVKPVGSQMRISYPDLEGTERTVDVEMEKAAGRRQRTRPIFFKHLPEGFGYIRIMYIPIDPVSFVPAFDRALEDLWHTDGLIIDIRNNPGGSILLPDQILGRFTHKKVNYGGMSNPQKGYLAPFYVVPRRPMYSSPVVMLIDERCGSAASYFPYAASYLENITLVGRPTMGVVSSPSMVARLPGGARVDLVASGLVDPSGNLVVEWSGVQPDVLLPYTLKDIRSGTDRDLLTAIEILKRGKL
ncbi:MAG: S41 family peptidase [Candidatus Aminicenantaceae bacterium]